MSTQQPGWLPDPTGQHQLRYWDGTGWTDNVGDSGVTSIDPLVPGTPPRLPPPGIPPPGRGFGHDYGYLPPGGPPRRSRTPLVVFIVLVLLAAGVGGAVLLTSGGGEDDEKKREYVEALAAAYPEADDALPVSESEAECLAEAEVDIIGVDALSEAVTPEQIRDNPEDGPSDWGIEPSREQNLEMLDAVQRCAEDLGAVFVEYLLAQFPAGLDVDMQAAGDCLADGFDDEAIRGQLAESMMFAGENEDLTEDQANVMFEWMDGCLDLRVGFVGAIAREVDAEVADCIGEGITDEWLRASMISDFTGDTTAAEDLDAELDAVIEDCTIT